MPPVDGADLLDFNLCGAQMFLQGVYGYHLNHNDRSNLDEGVAEDALCWHHWFQMTVQSAI